MLQNMAFPKNLISIVIDDVITGAKKLSFVTLNKLLLSNLIIITLVLKIDIIVNNNSKTCFICEKSLKWFFSKYEGD